jgi:hypothetical protein|tara:strand:+ start:5835 stop:6170 length:336 start_codon:yes stop_codon:yes gene_type:complete
MWVLMNDSFLSIVQDKDQEDIYLVRSRRFEDIEVIFGQGYEIYEGLGRDYRFRSFIPKTIVADAIHQRLLNIDYDNFKNSVIDDDRHDAYLEVWHDLWYLDSDIGSEAFYD